MKESCSKGFGIGIKYSFIQSFGAFFRIGIEIAESFAKDFVWWKGPVVLEMSISDSNGFSTSSNSIFSDCGAGDCQNGQVDGRTLGSINSDGLLQANRLYTFKARATMTNTSQSWEVTREFTTKEAPEPETITSIPPKATETSTVVVSETNTVVVSETNTVVVSETSTVVVSETNTAVINVDSATALVASTELALAVASKNAVDNPNQETLAKVSIAVKLSDAASVLLVNALAAEKAALALAAEKAALALAAEKAVAAATAALDAANRETEAANVAAKAADAQAAKEALALAADNAALKFLEKKFAGRDQALSNFRVFGKVHNFLSNDRSGQF
jgi:hypothetical protein